MGILLRNAMNGKEDRYIYALKGIAILAVTMVHSGAGQLPGIFGRIGEDGARGVQLFFILSGMLVFRSLDRAFPDRKLTMKGVLRWYLKKYIRLAPLYYLAILISMLTGSWSTYWLGTEGHVTVKNLLAHVFLLHGLFPHYTDSILYVEWYLGVLWIFYLISPLLFRYIDSFGKAVLFAVIVYIVNPELTGWLGSVLPVYKDPDIYNAYMETFGPFNQFLIFAFGFILYYFTEWIREKRILSHKQLSYAILIFAGILLYGQVNSTETLYRFTRHEMFGLFFSLLVISQVIFPTKLICNPFFAFVGRYSYGMYLFQFIWILFYERHIPCSGALGWMVKFVVSVFALLMISILLTKYYERPIREKLEKYIRESAA